MEPEADARRLIDKMLVDSGWILQDYDTRNLNAGIGVVVREFPLNVDAADYVLFIDTKPVGVIEAKKFGHTLSGVVEQSEKYIKGICEKFSHLPIEPPFSYESTGIETQFTNRRDPDHRSRQIFSFHRPELLQEWLKEEKTLSKRLKEIPKLTYENLWDCQKNAIMNLEFSLGQIVEKRSKITCEKEQEQLNDDPIFTRKDLDRTVVSIDQIRLVIRTFKFKFLKIFSNQNQTPKTLIYTKNDSDVEDITRIIRKEFGLGNDFCKKITYRTTEKPKELISAFRNLPMPRIAVTVDMIATGTDIKLLEYIIFMRDVQSKTYFDQMKGRGTRTIKSDDLIAVTPDAESKTYFVIIDVVDVCEHSMNDTHSLSKKPVTSFVELNRVTDKNADSDDIESLVYRLSSSISVDMNTLDGIPFNQKDRRIKFHQIFGDGYEKILNDSHGRLINQ